MRPGRRNFNVYGTVRGEQEVFGELVPGATGHIPSATDRVADCLSSMDIAKSRGTIVFVRHACGGMGG